MLLQISDRDPQPSVDPSRLDELWRSLREADQTFINMINQCQDIYKAFAERQQVDDWHPVRLIFVQTLRTYLGFVYMSLSRERNLGLFSLQSIQNNKTAIAAYEETVKMFKEQCRILNNYLDQARGSYDEHKLVLIKVAIACYFKTCKQV